MRVNMWGNEGTAEGGGLGTSGLHPQCCQNPHKHPSSRTEVLAAFHLAARGDSGWWFRQTAWGAHGHSPAVRHMPAGRLASAYAVVRGPYTPLGVAGPGAVAT